MPASQISPPMPSPTPSARERLRTFLETRRRAKDPVEDLEQFERELHTLFAAAEAEVVAVEEEAIPLRVGGHAAAGGLALDRRQPAQRDADPERPLAPTRLVAERQLGLESVERGHLQGDAGSERAGRIRLGLADGAVGGALANRSKTRALRAWRVRMRHAQSRRRTRARRAARADPRDGDGRATRG